MPVVSQAVAKIVVEGDSEAKSKLSDVKKSADDTQGGFKGMLQGMLQIAGGMGVFKVAGEAFDFLKGQVADVFKVTMEHQDVLAQTATVIKSTGDASGMSAKALNDLAESLSHTTTFSEDATQSGENLLLTFTGIGKDVFPQATRTMLDMSKAMGQDIKSSAIQLGKALNDPAQGLTALTRVGVTFTDQQKEMIQKMVAAGDTAGAQKIMLAELQREFGGSAEAAGKTFGGQLEILKNRLDETKEKIGTALLPVLNQFLGWFVSNGLPVLDKFSNWFANVGAPAIQNFGNFLSSNVVPAMQVFGGAISFIVQHVVDWSEKHQILERATRALTPVLHDLGSIATNLASDVGPFIQRLIDWSEKHQVLEKTTNTVKTALHDTKEVIKAVYDVVSPAIQAFKDWTDKHDPLKIAVNAVKTALNDGKIAINNTKNAIQGVVDWYQQWKPWIEGVAAAITTFFLPAIIKAGIEAITSGTKITTNFIGSMIQSGTEAVVNGAKVTLQFVQSMIKSGVEAVINGGKIATEFVANIIKTGVEGWTAAGKLAVFVGNIIKSGVEAVIAGGKVAASFIGSMITTGTQAVINGAKVVGSFIASMITAGAQAIISGAQIVASFVAGLITAGAEAIVSAGIFLATLVPSLLSVAAAVIAATWPFLLIAAVVAAAVVGIVLAIQHWGDITKWFQGVWGAFSGWFMGIMGAIGNWVGSVVGNIVGFFQSLPGKVMGFLQSLPGKIMDLWNIIKTDALNAGSNIVKAIGDGITGAIHFVTDAIGNVTKWISDHLPHSPAKVGPLRDLLYQGQQITEQVSQGMLASMPKLNTAIGQLVKPISVGLNAQTGGLSGLASSMQFPAMQSAQSSSNQVQTVNLQIDGQTFARLILPAFTDQVRHQVGIWDMS